MITLGYIDFDWHFAQGIFNCNCAKSEAMNAFDKVICGLLYRSNGQLGKNEISALMGLNTIDDPAQNKYQDRSENAIFEAALSSLVEYGLISESYGIIYLTAKGSIAVESGKKTKEEGKKIVLWIDENTRENCTKSLVKGLKLEPVEYTTTPEWNLLAYSPEQILVNQEKDLVNEKEGKSISSMSCMSMEYFVSHVSCKISFEIETKEFFVTTKKEIDEIDSFFSENSAIRNKILDAFFSNQDESIIFKSPAQIKLEETIVSFEGNNAEEDNIIYLSSVSDVVSTIDLNTFSANERIVFFSVSELTEEYKKLFKGINGLVFVDYLTGVNEQEFFIENNVCYRRVLKLRTTDVCVQKSAFYSVKPFVIEYCGKSYSIPLLYLMNENKYDFKAVLSPFQEIIVSLLNETITEKLKKLDRKLEPLYVFDALELCKETEMSVGEIEDDSFNKRIDELSDQIINVWNNKIIEEINKIEADFIAGEEMYSINNSLKEIEKFISDTPVDEETAIRFDEVKNRVNNNSPITGPKIHSQTVYILDTSVFMNFPDVLNQFELAHDKVVIPRAMEQELDGLSHDPAKGEAAKKAIKQIFKNETEHPQFISIKDNVNLALLPIGFDPTKNDNHMLATSIELSNEGQFEKIIVVSDDTIFVNNVNDLSAKELINVKIEAIDSQELLLRLGD